jgi:hypothetical protein
LAFGSYSGRIVGQARKVDHAVDAVQRAGRDIAHVRLDDLDPVFELRERLVSPVEPVE